MAWGFSRRTLRVVSQILSPQNCSHLDKQPAKEIAPAAVDPTPLVVTRRNLVNGHIARLKEERSAPRVLSEFGQESGAPRNQLAPGPHSAAAP